MTIIDEVDRLRKAIHPQEKINIVKQCEIVGKALESSMFQDDQPGLASYLGVSVSQISKMNRVYTSMLPAVKLWFIDKDVGVNKVYSVAKLGRATQEEFLLATQLIKGR